MYRIIERFGDNRNIKAERRTGGKAYERIDSKRK